MSEQAAASPEGAAALNRRALGRRLSELANADATRVLALDAAAPGVQPTAARIGLTGSPGAGKSTLGGRLAVHRSQQHRLGLLAIDPSSPLTGGAILGDRIRMDEVQGIERLYVRSLASRTASDGLAPNIAELLFAMEAAGFDELMLETVGVGQVEHAVRHQVDTLVLVLVPGAGDYVQAMKAGMMEVADIFVVNKADLAGAAQLATEVQSVLQAFPPPNGGWLPPVLRTSASDADSIAQLSQAIDRHQDWLRQRGDGAARQLQRRRHRLHSLLERQLSQMAQALDAADLELPLAQQVRLVVDRLRAVADG